MYIVKGFLLLILSVLLFDCASVSTPTPAPAPVVTPPGVCVIYCSDTPTFAIVSSNGNGVIYANGIIQSYTLAAFEQAVGYAT